MPQSYTKKSIRTEIVLGQGTFDGQNNTRIIEGLETDVSIEKPGLPDKNKAKIKIANMAYEDMAQLTMLAFRPLQSQKNLIRIFAGDQGQELSLAFAGEITSAWADFSGAPTVRMTFDAMAGAYPALAASPPVAASGSVSAESLIRSFAQEMGYSFKNEGIAASVSNAVFNGSPLEKAQAVAAQVGAELIIDDNALVLLSYDQSRSGNAVFLTAGTGMIGYPTFTSDGVALKCLYNPDLQLGGLVEIESVVPGASGTWKVTKLSHKLLAYAVASGPWMSQIEAAPLDAKPKDKKV